MALPNSLRLRDMCIATRIVMLAAVASLAAAGSADASSIFFLRGGNIWVASPPGSGAKQVTTDGSYDFVSSAKVGSAPPLAFSKKQPKTLKASLKGHKKIVATIYGTLTNASGRASNGDTPGKKLTVKR
jgi:hypothetical protein